MGSQGTDQEDTTCAVGERLLNHTDDLLFSLRVDRSEDGGWCVRRWRLIATSNLRHSRREGLASVLLFPVDRRSSAIAFVKEASVTGRVIAQRSERVLLRSVGH